jgi:hypothetical protein
MIPVAIAPVGSATGAGRPGVSIETGGRRGEKFHDPHPPDLTQARDRSPQHPHLR